MLYYSNISRIWSAMLITNIIQCRDKTVNIIFYDVFYVHLIWKLKKKGNYFEHEHVIDISLSWRLVARMRTLETSCCRSRSSGASIAMLPVHNIINKWNYCCQVHRHLRGPTGGPDPRERGAAAPDARERGRRAGLARRARHRFPQDLRELCLCPHFRWEPY